MIDKRTNRGKSHYNYGLPMEFIYDGLIYIKQFNGMYHAWAVDYPRTKENCLKHITFDQAEHIITNSSYISTILYLTDKVELKL